MKLVCGVAVATLLTAPTPASSLPAQAAVGLLPASATAGTVIEQVRPEQLAAYFLDWGPQSAAILVLLSLELGHTGPESTVGEYLAATVRAMAHQLDARATWTEADLDRLLTVQLVNPGRFIDDLAFRYQVVALLRQANDAAITPRLRHAMLEGLNRIGGVDFEIAETVAAAWGLIERSSTSRYVPPTHTSALDIDSDLPIVATVLVLTSQFIAPAEASSFLDALEALAPERDILVLSDQTMARSLGPTRPQRTHLMLTQGRNYTPWPRDPMILARRSDGGVGIIVRPNRQTGREDDTDLGRLLVAQLPAELDAHWHEPRWQTSSTPFHNGQILLTNDTVWVSVHSLEWAILERLGVDRVPVESFNTAAGIDRYLDAARTAALELGRLFGRQPRFVHALPETGTSDQRRDALLRLSGGGGFDLDSLVTIVPANETSPTRAIVASVEEGMRLLGSLSAEDAAAMRRTYGIEATTDVIASITETSRTQRAEGLDEFLGAVAENLAARGIQVLRIPTLLAPTNMLADRTDLRHADFLIGWNNVVISSSGGHHRAEGFASGLPLGDATATALFRAVDVEMRFLPPLTASVVRNGGYRCATNHLRGSPALTAGTQRAGAGAR